MHGKRGRSLTLLHAAHVAQLRLVLALLAGAGAHLQPVLLTDGAGAALGRRSRERRSRERRSRERRSRERRNRERRSRERRSRERRKEIGEGETRTRREEEVRG